MEQHQRSELWGHPKGLYILFFTELWERFSYYGMRAILVLYMISSATGDNAGLGWLEGDALALYGWYTMLVYVMSIPGGILADKFIGQKKAVLVGGLILVAGHSILAIEQVWAFYTGLLLIVLGVGGLKPNISTMVGGLYPPGDERRDKGFTIFYIGINVGAFLASLVVGYIGETIGWHYGFGLAGIGMLIGQIVFMFGQRYLKGVGEAPKRTRNKQKDPQSILEADDDQNTSLGELFSRLFQSPLQLIITIGLSIGGIALGYTASEGYEKYAYSALYLFLALCVGLLMMIYKDVNKIEKDRFLVLLLSFLIVIVFWGAFEQAGGLLNIYTKQKIDRVIDLPFMENAFEIPASVFQSVNPLFIIIFGTLVANFWLWWRHRGKESSSLFKMAIGTIIMGVGFIFMAIASQQADDGVGAKGMLILLILAYLFHTIGELSASPVALSFITKVAPVKYVSIMMGFYFAATGLGNKVAGTIGEASQPEQVKVELEASADEITPYIADTIIPNRRNFEIIGNIQLKEGEVLLTREGENLEPILNLEHEDKEVLKDRLDDLDPDEEYTAILRFEKDQKVKDKEEKGQGTTEGYTAKVEIFEHHNKVEFRTFVMIFGFTAAFGLLLILFLRKLKKLTHGAEEKEGTSHEEHEPYELADEQDKKDDHSPGQQDRRDPPSRE